MKKIGLGMIVKNEAKIIERCLDAVKPLVDYIIISDTGSTDGTPEVILRWMDKNKMSGVVVHDEWQDFATNRTSVIELMRQEDVDYCLMIDADFVCSIDPEFDIQALKDGLTDDVFNFDVYLGTIQFLRPLLTSNKMKFFYSGVLHEFLGSEYEKHSIGKIEGITFKAIQDSWRGTHPQKYQMDAKLLENALEKEVDPFLKTRYTFYLAQTYQLLGRINESIWMYERMISLGGWSEEVFYSLYQIAKMREQTGASVDELVMDYMKAYEASPARAEPLYHAIRLCNQNNRYRMAYILALMGIRLAKPPNGLFVEGWVYDYGMLDVFSVAAYWTKNYDESIKACNMLLTKSSLPASYVERVKRNINFAQDAMKATKA